MLSGRPAREPPGELTEQVAARLSVGVLAVGLVQQRLQPLTMLIVQPADKWAQPRVQVCSVLRLVPIWASVEVLEEERPITIAIAIAIAIAISVLTTQAYCIRENTVGPLWWCKKHRD